LDEFTPSIAVSARAPAAFVVAEVLSLVLTVGFL
jgi:hypothetical protein